MRQIVVARGLASRLRLKRRTFVLFLHPTTVARGLASRWRLKPNAHHVQECGCNVARGLASRLRLKRIYSLQLHLEKEELSLESSWESSLEPHPLRAFLASMCHARSCNPSDWYPSSKARTT